MNLHSRSAAHAGVVIVGAGLAGHRTAAGLRMAGYRGRVILVGREAEPAYERPALSKSALTTGAPPPHVAGADAAALERLDVSLQLGTEITSIDPDGAATTSDGTVLHWHHLVFATGAAPRLLHAPGGDLLHTLGSPRDSARLGGHLRKSGTHLVVVGGGFVGAEVASSGLTMGCAVTMLEAGSEPFAASLGTDVGALLADWYRRAGVDVVCGARVREAAASDHGLELRLQGGGVVRGDVALAALGVAPNDALFHEAIPAHGTTAGTGIPVDAAGRSLHHPRIWAVGDVAAYTAPGGVRRIEHWTHAAQSARRVAAEIAGACSGRSRGAMPGRAPHVRYAWSDQLGVRLQLVGETAAAHTVDIRCGDPARLDVRYLDSAGMLRGGLASGRPELVARWRTACAGAVTEGMGSPDALAS